VEKVRGRIVKSMMMLAIIAGLLTVTFAMPSVHAQDTVLDITCVADTTLTPGSTFSVDLTVDDVAGMFGYEFILRFDPSIVHAMGFAPYDPVFDYDAPSPVYIDNTKGYISSAASYNPPEIWGLTTADAVPLARFDFEVVGTGITPLELYYTVVVDVYGKLVDHIVDNGTFSNIWAEPFTVAVALDTGFVESRFFKLSKEKDIFQTLTGQFKNVGTVPTLARVNFRVFDAMGAKIADMTTEEVMIAPETTMRLSMDLDVTGLELKPATYQVEVRVQYIGWCTGWTTGNKGFPGAAKTTMELTFKLED
jgi:hypothetical protein